MGIQTTLSRLFGRVEHPERKEHAAHECCGGESKGDGQHRHEAGGHQHEHGAKQAKERGHSGGSGCH